MHTQPCQLAGLGRLDQVMPMVWIISTVDHPAHPDGGTRGDWLGRGVVRIGSLAPKPVVTYDEKLNHIKLVAQRGADARKFAEETGHFRTGTGARESAVRVFEGMAGEHPSEIGAVIRVLALQDTHSITVTASAAGGLDTSRTCS